MQGLGRFGQTRGVPIGDIVGAKHDKGMIRKSVKRFSEEIMPKTKTVEEPP
jgi:hypothetical protein